jgi:hypothetical protein
MAGNFRKFDPVSTVEPVRPGAGAGRAHAGHRTMKPFAAD